MRETLERRIYGTIALHPKKIPLVFSVLDIHDFIHYRKQIEILYICWKDNKDILIEFVRAGLKASEMTEVMGEVPVFDKLETVVAELKELCTAEKVKKLLTDASKNVPNIDLQTFIAGIQQNLIQQSAPAAESSDIEDIVTEFIENQLSYEEKMRNGQSLLGISCGFAKIDNLIDGLRKGHMWVIGGYTSLGKTFGALNIVASLIQNKQRAVVYSLEMSRIDILSRLIGILIGENSRAIAKGQVDQKHVLSALEVIKASDLVIIADKRELSHIMLSMHEQTLKKPVDVFVFDYLGLIQVEKARSDYERAKKSALDIQDSLKRFNIPGIVLSQVSNEAAKNGEQMVMGFKDAGDIAAAADLAIELVSGEESTQTLKQKLNEGKPVQIKWQIKKNRHGPVGYVLMEFDGKTGRFKEVDENNY